EAFFNFSSYDLDTSYCYNCGSSSVNLLEIKQSNIGMAIKYKFNALGRLNPIVGGVASFNMREYQRAYGGGYGNAESIKSNALDLGIMGGVDVALSDTWAIGVDIRYMFNITNRIDRSNSYNNYSYSNTNSIEEMQYYLFNV